MLYHYTSIDTSGKKHRGLLEAVSLQEAKKKLRSRGIVLLTITAKRKRLGKVRLAGTSLVTFTTQLSELLRAGIPLYESLLSLEEQARKEPYHPILLSLCEQIHEGGSLSAAMESFPDSFDGLTRALVAAGETVGALDQTLAKLSQLLTNRMKLRKQILTALLYPAVLAGFSLVIMTLLLTFVIPSLEVLFEGRSVGRLTQFVMGLSRLITRDWPWLLVGTAALVGAGIAAVKKTDIKQRFLTQLLRVPIIGRLMVQTAVTRFTRTLNTLLEGGVPMIDALAISRKTMRHPALEVIIEHAESRIVEGSALSREMGRSPLIPPLVTRMIAVGEEGGVLPSMLGKVADLYDSEVEKTLTHLTSLAQPVILLVMGVVVGVIMMAVLLPLTDIHAFMEG